MCECDCDACMNCEEEDEYKVKKVPATDGRFTKLIGDRDSIVIENTKHNSITHELSIRDGYVYQVSKENNNVYHDGYMDSNDWDMWKFLFAERKLRIKEED